MLKSKNRKSPFRQMNLRYSNLYQDTISFDDLRKLLINA